MPQQLSSVDDFRQQRDNLVELILDLLKRIWAQLDPAQPVASYNYRAGTIAAQVIAGQLMMSRFASQESEAVLRELGIEAPSVGELVPSAFAGFASDGRDLTSLLELPARTVAFEVARGAAPDAAMDAGLAQMQSIIATELIDANRAAMQVDIASRPQVTHFVRMLTLPSCSRCVVLAGRVYPATTAFFLRHPNCDCTAVPATEDVAGDLRTDPILALRNGQVRGMSRADTEAVLELGADLNKVVNVRRMTPLGWQYGSTVNRRITPRGTVKKTPAQILREAAGDRNRAIDQLNRFGYIVDRRRLG